MLGSSLQSAVLRRHALTVGDGVFGTAIPLSIPQASPVAGVLTSSVPVRPVLGYNGRMPDEKKVENIEAEVRRIVSDQLDLERDKVADDARLRDDLDADDLAVIEIVLAVEEHFEIDITDEQVEALGTVQDVIAVVKRALGASVDATPIPG